MVHDLTRSQTTFDRTLLPRGSPKAYIITVGYCACEHDNECILGDNPSRSGEDGRDDREI